MSTQHNIHISLGHLTNQPTKNVMVHPTSVWKHNKFSIEKLFETLLYIISEVDWVSCEEGNQSIKVTFKKLFCDITCFKSCKTKDKGMKLVIFWY